LFYILKFINQNHFFLPIPSYINFAYLRQTILWQWKSWFTFKQQQQQFYRSFNLPLLLWSLNKAKKSFILAKTFFLGLEVFSEQDIVLTLDDIRMFTSGLGLNEDDQDIVVTHLLESTCKAMLLRSAESEKVSFLPFSDLKWQINSFLFVTGNV